MLKKIWQKVKQVNIWHDKFVLVFTVLSVLANFAIWMILALRIKPSVYPIPLHYNIYGGIDTIDLWYKVFVVPGFGLFLLLVNFVASLLFYRREKFVTHLLTVSNFVVQVLLLVASVVITQEI